MGCSLLVLGLPGACHSFNLLNVDSLVPCRPWGHEAIRRMVWAAGGGPAECMAALPFPWGLWELCTLESTDLMAGR